MESLCIAIFLEQSLVVRTCLSPTQEGELQGAECPIAGLIEENKSRPELTKRIEGPE